MFRMNTRQFNLTKEEIKEILHGLEVSRAESVEYDLKINDKLQSDMQEALNLFDALNSEE